MRVGRQFLFLCGSVELNGGSLGVYGNYLFLLDSSTHRVGGAVRVHFFNRGSELNHNRKMSPVGEDRTTSCYNKLVNAKVARFSN